MMKTLMKLSILLAVSCFLNPVFAATPKVETGQIHVSCPFGPCGVTAGAVVIDKNGHFSESDYYTLKDKSVIAGFTISLNVKACDQVFMHSNGLFVVHDKEEFVVAPCNDDYLPTKRRVNLGDTIRVTGTLGLVNYTVVAG